MRIEPPGSMEQLIGGVLVAVPLVSLAVIFIVRVVQIARIDRRFEFLIVGLLSFLLGLWLLE